MSTDGDKNRKINPDDPFWKKVIANSSRETDDTGNKIPETRPVEELIEMLKEDPSAVRNFTKSEKRLLNEELKQKQEEFSKQPLADKEFIIEQNTKMQLMNPDLSDQEKKMIQISKLQYLKQIRAEHKPEWDKLPSQLDAMLDEMQGGAEEKEPWQEAYADESMDPTASLDEMTEAMEDLPEEMKDMAKALIERKQKRDGEPADVIRVEPEEDPFKDLNVDDVLSEVFEGEEIVVLKEYTKKDYSIMVDGPLVKFHIDGEVPPMTSQVWSDVIKKLELTYNDNGFWKFPRAEAELRYWLTDDGYKIDE